MKNKKGLQQAKIQVSGKDIKTGKNKIYTKRVYNDDGLSDAKFRKYVEKCSIKFEEEVARAYREGTATITARVLTFPELMKEWMAHVKADFSLSYYGRAETALTKFVAYLKENNLYDKPISEITVRDVQVFFNRYMQKTYTKNLMIRLIKQLPANVKGSEVNRKGVISSNAFYKLKHDKTIRRDAVERLCTAYGLDINVYFEEVDSDKITSG